MKTTEIYVKRLIPATPEQVYAAWLNPAHPGSPWHGVAKAIVPAPEIDGLFYSMYRLEGKEMAHYGRFVTLEAPQHIAYTWVSEATQGRESLVTLHLEKRDHQTQVNITHSELPDTEEGRFHQNAWGYVLSRMKKQFTLEETP